MSVFAEIQSQECNFILRGQINDEDNQEHLSFAVVKLLPGGQVAQSDDHGNFIFGQLCAGRYQLFVSHVGCRDTSIFIELRQNSEILVRMPHSLNALSDVEVVAEHQELRPPQVISVLYKKDLDRVRGEVIAHQLRSVDGMRVFSTGPAIARPMLNGMQGYRVLMVNNGVRLEGQQWGTEHAPEIDPFTAGRISVISGASAVRYGSDAIGGVIITEPDDMPDTAAVSAEVQGSYESNGRIASGSAMIQGYFDRVPYLSWRVQGSHRNGGDIRTPQGFLSNTAVRESNYSYALDYHRKMFGVSVYYSQFNSRYAIFEGAHIGNLTDLKSAFLTGTTPESSGLFSRKVSAPYQDAAHETIKLHSDIHTGRRSRIRIQYSNQYNHRVEFDGHGWEDDDHEEAGAAADYRLTSHHAEIGWEHDYIRSWRGAFGVQAFQQLNTCEGMFFIPNYSSTGYGIFATERFVRPHFEVDGGIRYDIRRQQAFYYSAGILQQPALTFENLSYSLGSLYRGGPLRANISLSSGWRPPAINELYSNGLHHGAAAVEKGNPYLDKEHCVNLSGGAEWHHGIFKGGFSAYRYWFGNFVYYRPDTLPVLTVRGAFPSFSYVQSPAVISGADIRFSADILRFCRLQNRAMWIRGRENLAGQPLIYIPADRYEMALNFHSTGKGTLRDVYFEPSLSFTAKQTRVPENSDFAPPPEGYTLFGIEAGVSLHAGRQPLYLSISGRNLLNARYRDYLDRFRYYADAAGASVIVRLRVPLTVYDKQPAK